ncbi:MAG: 16S rRNA (cytidine(1402)-2'-O)-methyltransferase [Candidatus Adiutrix sp.]|jgi:16S rRNA (cytidine1402-2'-O)-methyltransferase|nr:16S rRNA (cytidine(1402)-2'-O)-methyltransferase [Candidatus Adiutrix sp.]
MSDNPAGLYLAPSPLGNLGDLTPRVAAALKEADLVAAEDTRRALKLLSHLGLRRPLISYREQNHRAAWPRIASVLAAGGRVALLTDAGAPGVSDPGAALTAAARAAGFAVIPLPGPSAVITALMASGFSADRFTFAGFIPFRAKERRGFLARLKELPWTLVFFEAPHRLTASLADLADIFGPRPALLAREMTKLHEEFLAGDLPALAADAAARPRKGEMTIVVAGAAAAGAPAGDHPPFDPARLASLARSDPRPSPALAAELARESGRPRAEIYKLLVAARAADREDGSV